MYESDDLCSNLENKCYDCKLNYVTTKLMKELIINNGDDYFVFKVKYENFNNSFMVRNLPLYCDRVLRGKKDYCIKYNEEFERFVRDDIFINKFNKSGG